MPMNVAKLREDGKKPTSPPTSKTNQDRTGGHG